MSSGYPAGEGFIGIGIGMFILSLLFSLITLPIIICLVDKFYAQKLEVKLGGDKDKKYEIDYYRIIICFLVGVIVLMLLNIVMSAHGIFFLSKIYMNEPYLYEGLDRNMYVYIIPSSHYVLYFLEAAYEAAEENLLLWGFLFLVNFIGKLCSKDFYFKTFTFFLAIRVSFVFACHFNIWELIMNEVEVKEEFHKFALAIYPYHTSPKILRIAEILCSMIIFSAFAIYTWILTARKMQEMDVNGVSSPLIIRRDDEAQQITEIKFVRKYLIGYTLFLVIHLVVNIIECHFISLTVGLKDEYNMTQTILSIEMGMSIFADVLAFIPTFLFLLFITIIAFLAVKNRAERQEMEESQKSERFRKKRLFLAVPIILFCTLFTAAFIGYLKFTYGDYMQVTLHPGDYLVLNLSDDTRFSKFIRSCDCRRYEISSSPTYQLGDFDFLEFYYGETKYHKLNNTRILRYETYVDNNKIYHQHIDVPSDPMYMWFPAKTYFNISESVNFTVAPYTYPCYHGFTGNKSTPNDGLRILCPQNEQPKEYLNCTKNESNTNHNCSLQNDSMIWSEDHIPFSLTAHRPYYTGKNLNPDSLSSESLIQFNYSIPYMNDSTTSNNETFYLTCHHNQWKAGGILGGILVFMGLYLTAWYICYIKCFARACVPH